MTTPAQAAARAQNGRKHSTGPKTPSGKAASSANAITHGGYAVGTPVVPRGPLAEDPEVYDAFSTAIIESQKVVGPAEEELARMIASLMWRARRPAVYEAAYLADRIDPYVWSLPTMAQGAIPENQAAARVLRNPASEHPMVDLEMAAIAVGHHVDLFMEDTWPQPRPTTSGDWNKLIDQLLAGAGSTREQAALDCDQEIVRWRVADARQAAEAYAAEVARVIEGELLMKTARIEAHIGRELSRNVSLLRTLQADRRAAEAENAE